MSVITLNGASLGSAAPSAWTVTEEFRGWNATLTFPSWINTRFDGRSPVGITVRDHRNVTCVCPPMLVGPRARDHNRTRTAKLSLIDETSWKLGSGSESWDTFLEGTTSDIAEAVGERFGVTIVGAPSIPVHIEDFKLCSGWSVLDRIERVYGGDILILPGGNVQFRAPGWATHALNPRFAPHSVVDHYDPLSRYEKIFVSKNLGTGTADGPQYYDFTEYGRATGELAFPLGPGLQPYNDSSVGSVTWVFFWDGPPDSGGKIVAFESLGDTGSAPITLPVDGTWPATHFSCSVNHDKSNPTLPIQARLKVTGYPWSDLPAGIDGAISEEFGTGRGAPFAFSDTLIPSLTFAQSNWEHWVRKANRGTNTLTATGPLDCRVRVGQLWDWPPLGLGGRVERVTHSGGARVPTTEILVNCDEG